MKSKLVLLGQHIAKRGHYTPAIICFGQRSPAKIDTSGFASWGRYVSNIESRDNDRREFLKAAGKFAAITPPAMVFLLSTTLNSTAIAQSAYGDHAHCDQGVGNGSDGCTPGNSFNSNDDLPGTGPGSPGASNNGNNGHQGNNGNNGNHGHP